MTSCSKRGYHDRTDKKKRVRLGQIFVTISKVSPNIYEKSCQKSVTISASSCSILLSFCQIFLTITIVLDGDLGQSATSKEGRDDFTQLAADVALGHVGIVFGWEVSRLSRTNADWYQLLDLAAVVGTLIADIEGVYDPCSDNDRLLLGLYVRYHQRPLSRARLAHPDTLSPSK